MGKSRYLTKSLALLRDILVKHDVKTVGKWLENNFPREFPKFPWEYIYGAWEFPVVEIHESVTSWFTTGLYAHTQLPLRWCLSPCTAPVVRVGTPLTTTCNVIPQHNVTFAWLVGGAMYNHSSGSFVISATSPQSSLTLLIIEEGDLGNVTCVARSPNVQEPMLPALCLRRS